MELHSEATAPRTVVRRRSAMIILDMDYFWDKLNGECTREAWATVSGLPNLSVEDAVTIQSELLEKYGEPEFQLKLYQIYANYDPQSLEYNQKMSALFRSVRARVLPKYGFPAGQEGDIAMPIALSEFRGHPEVDTLTACIDEALYAAEAPMVKDSTNLSKRQILSMCRAQLAAFKKAEFQDNLQIQMRRASFPGNDSGSFRFNGCSELALAEQRPLLRQYGLEPNERGMHSLLQQVAQHIMDPEVAACTTAINTLLGMDKTSCMSFTERAMDISVNDPCPRVTKEEKKEQQQPFKVMKSIVRTTPKCETVLVDLAGADEQQRSTLMKSIVKTLPKCKTFLVSEDVIISAAALPDAKRIERPKRALGQAIVGLERTISAGACLDARPKRTVGQASAAMARSKAKECAARCEKVFPMR